MSSIKLENLNPRHLKVEYAVRGELAIKAEEYRVKLKNPNHGLPFDKVVSTNIGNPQQRGLDQKPLTFVRQVRFQSTKIVLSHSSIVQVAALMEVPELADKATDLFPSDVIARAKLLQEEIGSIGAYSHSQGVPYIRESVAKFIEGESTKLASQYDP